MGDATLLTAFFSACTAVGFTGLLWTRLWVSGEEVEDPFQDHNP